MDLSDVGKKEAVMAGQVLKENGFEFDIVYTSLLKRSINTYNTIANEINSSHLPVIVNEILLILSSYFNL